MAIDFPPSDPAGRELVLLTERAKYERFVEQEMSDLVERTLNDVLDTLLSRRYRDLTAAQRQRLNELYKELAGTIRKGYTTVSADLTKRMQDYAIFEADVARVQVTTALAGSTGTVSVSLGPSLPKGYLTSIAKLPIQGLRIGEWFDAQAETMSRETRRIIQQGLVEGKGSAEISRRIVADQRAAGPVLSRRAKNEAKAITRTTVNAVQNDAALASYEALPRSVSDSYQWVSVRDNRLSPTCAALDGRVWKYDDPARRSPPAHVGCRSSLRPLLRGAETSLAAQKDLPLTFRSMGDWLRAQPVTTQNEILGRGRAELWRDGKLSLADAVDSDNRVLSLKELRARLGVPVGGVSA